ncbi:MAG: hydroxymethylbilane synthase [Thermoguttaceae bacterium]|nr:hydroxymethylbilane synthase [Thermoguttaceae bacterium]
MKFRIGTRSSSLAVWQAESVRSALAEAGAEGEIRFIETRGDRNRSDSIARLGATGVFAKEIQVALLEGRVDIAVHSLKDLPVEPVPGLRFAATLAREDVSDVLVSRAGWNLESIPSGARVGTGSLRRRCQLSYRLGGSVQVSDVRGNVETRLKKLDAGEYDALLLAAAGLKRLGFGERVAQGAPLDPLGFLPAPGQGALGLECRQEDRAVCGILARINDTRVYAAVTAERAFLGELQGGCLAPVGAYARFDGDRFILKGRILSLDGAKQFDVEKEIPAGEVTAESAARLGQLAAGEIRSPEVEAILDEVRALRKGTPS